MLLLHNNRGNHCLISKKIVCCNLLIGGGHVPQEFLNKCAIVVDLSAS